MQFQLSHFVIINFKCYTFFIIQGLYFMQKHFSVPEIFSSPRISALKDNTHNTNIASGTFEPILLDFGVVRFSLACSFGFCFGVQRAIDKAYKILNEYDRRPIYFLSEMIHNPAVNEHLRSCGVVFLFSQKGDSLVDLQNLSSEDIVVLPAFGASLEVIEQLRKMGINTARFDTTCPYVQRVWHAAEQLGDKGFTVVIHGCSEHEETKALFSRARACAPCIIIQGKTDAQLLVDFIEGKLGSSELLGLFVNRISFNFNPSEHLRQIGVVNQTTMLADETKEIAFMLKEVIERRYGVTHFADTSNTLCYATCRNQNATAALTKIGVDLALVVGGYNSSNTAHLYQICKTAMSTYFVSNASDIISRDEILSFDLEQSKIIRKSNWLPRKEPFVHIAITAGASCPDSVVESVINRILSFYSIVAM